MLKVCLSICVVLASAISNSHALPDFTYPDEFVTRFEACRAGFDNNTQFGTSGFTKFTVPVELDSVEKRFEAAKRIHGVFPLLGSGMRIELQSLKRNVPNRAHDYLYQVTYEMKRYKVEIVDGEARAQLMEPEECLTPTFD
ncbi:uncharacterized protein LOC142356258 [Convolutriloba macropyga]|uniref:uncharacterized protein LOC142356258 n=1 Tax=Convolutriloba macropyga TaxID=536237 RepID=UPI003F51B7A5